MGKNLIICVLTVLVTLLFFFDYIGYRFFQGNWTDSKIQTLASVFSSLFSMAAVVAAASTIILNERRSRSIEIQQNRALFNRVACWTFLRRTGETAKDTALLLCIDNLTSYPICHWKFSLKSNPSIEIGSAQEGLISPGKHEFVLLAENANHDALLEKYFFEFRDLTGTTWCYSTSEPLRLVRNGK